MSWAIEVAHPSRSRGALKSAAGATDRLSTYGEGALPGGDIGRMAPPTRTGFAVGKVAMAVLASQASLKYTRPLGWPKQKVEAAELSAETEALHLDV